MTITVGFNERARRRGVPLYESVCVEAHSLCANRYECLVEVVLKDEGCEALEHDVECPFYEDMLRVIGAWIQFASPLDRVVDPVSGHITIVLVDISQLS